MCGGGGSKGKGHFLLEHFQLPPLNFIIIEQCEHTYITILRGSMKMSHHNSAILQSFYISTPQVNTTHFPTPPKMFLLFDNILVASIRGIQRIQSS